MAALEDPSGMSCFLSKWKRVRAFSHLLLQNNNVCGYGSSSPDALGRMQSLQKLCLKAIGRQLKHFCNLRLHPAVAQTLSGPEKELIYVYDLSRLDVFEAQAFLQTVDTWCCKVERNRRPQRDGPVKPKRIDQAMKSFLRYVLLPPSQDEVNDRLHELRVALGFAAPSELKLRETTATKKARKWVAAAPKSDGGKAQDMTPLLSSCSDTISQAEIVCYRLPVASVGCGMIATILQQSTALLKLRLSNCQIADAGAILIASGLRQQTTVLQLLDLSNDESVYRGEESMDNEIGSSGVRAIAIALEQNRTLKQIDLSGNPVGFRGALELAAMLRKNRSLQQLHLDRTKVQNGGEHIIDAFEQSKTLKQLSMLWCGLRTGIGARLASIQASKTAP